MAKPDQPEDPKGARGGLEDGSTKSTDQTRKPDRPVDEEDVFGGHERVDKTQDVNSGGTKP